MSEEDSYKPRGDESYRISVYGEASSSRTLWVVWHLLRVISETFDCIQRQSFLKKKILISYKACHFQNLAVCHLFSCFWTRIHVACLRLLWDTNREPSFSLLLHSETLKGLWKHPLLTAALLSLLLCKLNSDFLRSVKPVGRTRCQHIVAIDENSTIQAFVDKLSAKISAVFLSLWEYFLGNSLSDVYIKTYSNTNYWLCLFIYLVFHYLADIGNVLGCVSVRLYVCVCVSICPR